MICPICQRAFTPRGRQRYDSQYCCQRAYWMRRIARAGIIDGQPVPYSLTLPLDLPEHEARQAAASWLAAHKPGMRVTRVEGRYVFYGA